MIEKQYTIMASTGFPRAATLLVRAACKVHAHITLLYQEKSVELKHPPKSLIEVMTLGITPGTQIQIRAEGIDEEQALQEIEELMEKSGLIYLQS
ncbi:HPr family phosphocarrier protein [Bacillus subtilis]|nr:HPr family phosphocarrier protein [Bacillus subtilis]